MISIHLLGTDEDDVIQGFNGNDTLDGLGGSDRAVKLNGKEGITQLILLNHCSVNSLCV